MEDIVKSIVALLANGGSTAVIGILLLVVVGLVWDRLRMAKELAKSLQQTLDAKESEKKIILEIVEKYHLGNMTMAQAINEIKLVLTAIQSRIK
ncbi:MAG TPA: hypothetical protein VFM18_16870 [Methanosarcina sp.]|nr:hypothetical protein [Methanosarcina sp.]